MPLFNRPPFPERGDRVNSLSAANRTVFEAIGHVAGLLIYGVAAVIAIDVVGRLLGMPVRWPFEAYPYIAYWSALLGAGYVTYRNGNVRMDLLVEQGWLGPFRKLQPYIDSLFSTAYCIFMIWAGALFVLDLQESGRVTSDLRVPLYYHALAIPIGFLLAVIAIVSLMVNRDRKPS